MNRYAPCFLAHILLGILSMTSLMGEPHKICLEKFLILQSGLEKDYLDLIDQIMLVRTKTQEGELTPGKRAELHRMLSYMVHRLKNALPQTHKDKLIAVAHDKHPLTARCLEHAQVEPNPKVLEFCQIFL